MKKKDNLNFDGCAEYRKKLEASLNTFFNMTGCFFGAAAQMVFTGVEK